MKGDIIMVSVKRKVLISSDNEKLYTKCSTMLSYYYYETTIIPRNGAEVIAAIKKQSYDVVLMESSMAVYDAIEVMKRVRKSQDNKSPLLMVIFSLGEALVHELCSTGVDYIFIRPVEEDIIVKRIISFIETTANISNKSAKQEEVQPVNLGEMVTGILHNIGMPAHLSGYTYIRDAIIIAIESPDILRAITKELYPAVAEKNDTTSSSVERAMRTAIEVAWNRGSEKVLSSYFGSSYEKPTNSEFISKIINKIQLQSPNSLV